VPEQLLTGWAPVYAADYWYLISSCFPFTDHFRDFGDAEIPDWALQKI
jgi:hypothetical protein